MKNTTLQTLTHTALSLVVWMTMQACTTGKSETPAIPDASDPIPVKVMSLEKSSATTSFISSGRMTTDDETILAFKTGGVVRAVLVKEGDAVKKGQLLATLDLTEINALVSQSKLQLEKATRDFDRARNLFRDSVATLEQMQNAETALAIAREQSQTASFNKSFSEIHAPSAGYILRKFVNAGQVVSTGDPVVQTNGAVRNEWILKTGVSDRQWAGIKINEKATVKIDAFPGITFPAFVKRKAETSDPQTGAFTIELQVTTNGQKVATGMFGSATLASAGSASDWSVPYEAVLDANDDEGYVFVTDDGKTARKQKVTIASFDGNTIHISKGLEGVKSLIISGSAYLNDQSPVTIQK